MSKKTLLLTRPMHDLPTQYLYFLSGELKRLIDDVGEVTVIELDGKEATRIKFEQVMDKINPRLLILNGHGSYDSVWGHEEIILDKTNVDKLKSKIVYAVVCDSSKDLAEFAIRQGQAEAYIGYGAKFMIVTDPERSTTPSKDKNLQPFKEAYINLALSLVSGVKVSDSLKEARRHMIDLIREYGVRGIKDKYGDANLIRFALYWDLFFLTTHGNPEAVF